MIKDENSLYWIWLSEKCGVASKEFGVLATRYENPFDLYGLEADEIEHLEGIGNALKARLGEKSLENAYSILRYCKQNDVEIISYGDARYPSRLKTIEDPPVLLYVKGRLPDLNSRLCVGMVGTRKMSEYGRQSAYKISYELAAANAVVVSGMALGVDGVAACGALAAKGSTVAVLGCGISVIYPKEHEALWREIVRHGAVVTEYAPMEKPFGYHFPKRNRLISGLCQGVLVVEGAEGSGALITAKCAIEQGRELFALPGKINESNSDGPNLLIQNGAHVALAAEDILRHYDFLYHDMINYRGLRQATLRATPEETALGKYGVAGLYERKKAAKPKQEKAQSTQTELRAEKQTDPKKAAKRERVEAVEASEPKTSVEALPESDKLLSELDEVSRKIYEAMPKGRAVSPDGIVVEGVGIGEIITSLTLLELSGLVSSQAGGLYCRH